MHDKGEKYKKQSITSDIFKIKKYALFTERIFRFNYE